MTQRNWHTQAPEGQATHIIPCFESTAPLQWEGIRLEPDIFNGKKGQTYTVAQQNNRYCFVGLGPDPTAATARTVMEAFSYGFHGQNTVAPFVLHLPDTCSDAQATAIWHGLRLGTYGLGHFKKNNPQHPFTADQATWHIVSKASLEADWQQADALVDAQLRTRYMVDLPPREANPMALAEWAQQLAKHPHVQLEILDRDKAESLGFHAFLAVARGSVEAPVCIVLRYRPQHATTHIGLVGKGITFDTGGLNIKTSAMQYMKCDMAGGAAVLGAFQALVHRQAPLAITAVVPACENAIGARAYYPSEVLQSHAGSSIEITDTDAEGRLILADALSYICTEDAPDYLVDLATLTGSCAATFGPVCAGMMGSDPALANRLQQAGMRVGEKVWPLPLFEEYESHIESDIADVKNYSGKPFAGAISAGIFLRHFTHAHPHWVHLDIAGVAFAETSWIPAKHATGFGVHLLVEWAEQLGGH